MISGDKILHGKIIKRDLPDILKMDDGALVSKENWPRRREELLNLLSENIYGHTPDFSGQVQGKVIEEDKGNSYGGKVSQEKIELTIIDSQGQCSFPFYLFVPKAISKPPVFLHIAFRPDIPDRYSPVEEITDNGFALVIVCYKDMVNDNLFGDYNDGLGKLYIGNRARRPNEWGKIGMWAFGASRILDYLCGRDDIDREKVAVIGHSRLGKTALWCGAQDERFFMAVSNNSGIGGAAITKYSTGEQVIDFIRAGSWDWFCEKFKDFDGKEDRMPYDQHFLLATMAPRLLLVGSAFLDKGADPESEFLSCFEASKAYKTLGYEGLITPDGIPVPNSTLHEGRIGYHMRDGKHFFSRYDWNQYMQFFKGKIERGDS